MDFFDHQDRARRKTGLLVAYFALAVVGVVVAVYAASVGILTYFLSRSSEPEPFRLWHPELFVAVTCSVIAVIATGTFYKIIMLGTGGEHVAVGLGGKKIPANTRDLSERILLNVVEEMALASGTPVPPVYVMNDEPGINAFAAGTTPQNAVIGITRGAIDTLSRDELQGVMAHEFSHILNGDMRLNIRLMGLLHGILVLALIGYMIIRILGNSNTRSSSSSNKKGGGGIIFAIIAAGAALWIIGYVGVFFAHLIKSAVSRQREYLADASAVQFTRNPQGISDALKKIGGWAKSSKIAAPRAEEASHMFFGEAMFNSFFATHPPLPERIRRLDPNFSGAFPKTSIAHHDKSEIIDPQSLSQKRSSLQQAHVAALAGAEHFHQQPSELVESVGEPSSVHIDHVHDLVDALAPVLADDLRDPLGAVAVIYSLLLAQTNASLREEQLKIIAKHCDSGIMQELRRVLPTVDTLAPEQRLPVICMALPALHQMSPPQIQNFYLVVRELIHFDRQVSVFEYAVHRYIAKRLLPRLRPAATRQEGNQSFAAIAPHFALVLSFLARLGDANRANVAFEAGLSALNIPSTRLAIVDAADCSIKNLDGSLDRLATAAPKLKKQLLSAFAACVAEDRHVSIEETELLRVIADALGCPVPPVLDLVN